MPAQSKKSNKYAPSTWGAGEVLLDLEVPSGQLCQVRRPGVTGLIKAGILDSLDSLTGLVQSEHIERVAKGEGAKITPEDISNLASNKDKLAQALTLADKVAEYVVVQPSLLRPVVRDEKGNPRLDDSGAETELADADRKPGQIYTDAVDLVDKMYIFQFVVGGVSDLETFRKEFDQSLAGLAAFTGTPGPA
jgi:hypothetical protein